LTGRTDIWAGLIESIKMKPWLGNGYGVYWLDPLGPSYYVRLQLEWGIPSAHNGWMDTWLSIGAVGVGLFALLFLLTTILAFDRLRKGGTETYWVILSTIMFFAFSMSESTILQQNDLSWVMFVATSAPYNFGARLSAQKTFPTPCANRPRCCTDSGLRRNFATDHKIA